MLCLKSRDMGGNLYPRNVHYFPHRLSFSCRISTQLASFHDCWTSVAFIKNIQQEALDFALNEVA